MRIVHVITRLLRAGSEENTIASCDHQARSGHEVHLLHGEDFDPTHYNELGGRIHIQKLESLVHRISPKHDAVATVRMVKLFRKWRPDVVHTHQSKAGILGRVAAAAARVPLVIHGVHIVPFDNVSLAERLVYIGAERTVAPLTDGFVHVSSGTRAAYRAARIGIKSEHFIVRSGMELSRFSNAQKDEALDALLGRTDTVTRPKVILMLAALEPRKRHVEFLQGFAAAADPDTSVLLVIAGDGPVRPQVEATVDELGIRHRVILTGHVADPERLIALADVCVLASMREGLPRVVVQYLAGGKPVVVSPVAGIEEVVHDELNGLIVRSSAAEEVARAAVDLARDGMKLAKLTSGARQSDVHEWSFD